MNRSGGRGWGMSQEAGSDPWLMERTRLDFERAGVTLISGAIPGDWVNRLRDEVGQLCMLRPDIISDQTKTSDRGRFLMGRDLWKASSVVQDFITTSPCISIARSLMQSRHRVCLVNDRLFLKEK